MSWSERSLHEWILALRASEDEGGVVVGTPGSDAAVLTRPLARPVACVDQVVEGRHFTPAASAFEVGYKAAARALSDLAATAATPRALLSTLRADDAAASAVDEARLREILRGVWRTGREHGAPLIGGDIAGGAGPLSVSVTALGDFEFAGDPPGRERARAGDVVLLTGAVGGSLLGRHLRIRPLLAEGRWLYARGARTLMDVSDGLALDVERVAARSKVGIQLELERIPVHADAELRALETGRPASQHALTDGEDHELIVFASLEDASAMLAARDACVPGLCRIGHVVAGAGLWTRRHTAEVWARFQGTGGYAHGSS